MPIKLIITFGVSLLVLGASYAFADGMLNDAEGTRARGGVGNYLFRAVQDAPRGTAEGHSRNELVNNESLYENDASFTSTETDSLSVRQSTAYAGGRTLTFSTNSAHLDSTEARELDTVATELTADPAIRARVTGYADSNGTAAQNLALSQSRAKNIVRGLRDRGVAQSQISWNARGEREPATDNATADGRARNRRVEIHFQE